MTEEKYRHGGPWDRGAADSYYRRGSVPHYYKGASYSTPRVERDEMTEEEIAEYMAGYDYNENVLRDFKEWE